MTSVSKVASVVSNTRGEAVPPEPAAPEAGPDPDPAGAEGLRLRGEGPEVHHAPQGGGGEPRAPAGGRPGELRSLSHGAILPFPANLTPTALRVPTWRGRRSCESRSWKQD